VALGAGSLDVISGSTPILDFSGKPENLTFIVKGGDLLVGWGNRIVGTSSTIAGVDDFEHMVWVTDVA
jgi:hypothetical protein